MSSLPPSGVSAYLVDVPADSPFRLENERAYRAWRDRKLHAAESALTEPFIEIADPERPSPAEIDSIRAACRANNMALYRMPALKGDESRTRQAMRALSAALGLGRFEDHRSAGPDGIVPIEVADTGGRAGFIPFSTRAINWHTDGYYSYRGPDRLIRAMVLHCVRDAADGGENGLLDQDVAYIRLRDDNPAHIEALMHPEAMTIPSFDDAEGPSHGAVAGPVFVVNGDHLTMRYTIRKRNIEWREDAALDRARNLLADVLEADPLIRRARLNPDDGVACNNVLHDRRAFNNAEDGNKGRLLLRIRSYDRIG
ncbi:MAG: TauD/TfdA family dioxygenase [Rhizobiaceae bacterium]